MVSLFLFLFMFVRVLARVRVEAGFVCVGACRSKRTFKQQIPLIFFNSDEGVCRQQYTHVCQSTTVFVPHSLAARFSLVASRIASAERQAKATPLTTASPRSRLEREPERRSHRAGPERARQRAQRGLLRAPARRECDKRLCAGRDKKAPLTLPKTNLGTHHGGRVV